MDNPRCAFLSTTHAAAIANATVSGEISLLYIYPKICRTTCVIEKRERGHRKFPSPSYEISYVISTHPTVTCGEVRWPSDLKELRQCSDETLRGTKHPGSLPYRVHSRARFSENTLKNTHTHVSKLISFTSVFNYYCVGRSPK